MGRRYLFSLAFAFAFPLGAMLPTARAEILPTDPDLGLADVVEAALVQSPESERLAAEMTQAEAMAARSRSFLDGPPSVGFSYRNDALADDTGMSETEGWIDLPVRRPGLKAASERQAERMQVAAASHTETWRLMVAGQVRGLLARLDLAEAQLAIAERELATARKLEEQVRKRLDRGDVPRSDLVLAQEESVGLEVALREVRLQRDQVIAEYRRITGLEHRPAEWQESPVGEVPLTQHPDVVAAQAQLRAAEAGRSVTREQGRSQPTFGFSLRREEDGRDSIESAGVSISLPIQLQRLRAPEMARAGMDVAGAGSDLRLIERSTRLAIEQAGQALEAARDQLERAQRRQTLAEETLQMADKAYALGETGLMDLLQVRARSYTAQRQLATSRVVLKRTIAEYNQAKGVTP